MTTNDTMATNYRRGADFERRMRAWLESRGAFVVRAAGSLGPVDLATHWPNQPPWFVQCRRDGKLSADERAELVALARRYNAAPVLASPGGRGFAPKCETLH